MLSTLHALRTQGVNDRTDHVRAETPSHPAYQNPVTSVVRATWADALNGSLQLDRKARQALVDVCLVAHPAVLQMKDAGASDEDIRGFMLVALEEFPTA